MAGAHELFTEDKLEYNFFPVTTGSLHFKVRASNDAHVSLTSGPSETDPMYEVLIGGWDNGKTAIRRSRTKPDKAIVDTPAVLSGTEFRGFWIRWSNGVIEAGKEGEASPFISWEDPEPFAVGHFGICTGWGATGSWIIEDGAEITTADSLEYNYRPVPSGCIDVEVQSPSNAHIALTSGAHETEPMYEVILGGWNNQASVIRYNREKPDKIRAETPDLMSNGQFKRFHVQWHNGTVTVKHNGSALLEWTDPAPIGVTHFGVRTAWGAEGQWKVHAVDPRTATLAPSAPPASQPGWVLPVECSGGDPVWVDSRGGEVPPNAFSGGFDNEQLYVGRASHEGAIIPGKVVPSHGVCYIAWGGQEHGKEEYQVLTDCAATWVPSAGGEVPVGALPAGETEDGEPLFVGRAQHEGTMTVGKVQGSHNTCYIPYGGLELGFQEYEVLVSK